VGRRVNAAVRGTVLHAGTASGPALVLREPLS
jgi:hypothetical protein